MGLLSCNIILDNPYGTYYAGQTVSGRVEFSFDSMKKVRGMDGTMGYYLIGNYQILILRCVHSIQRRSVYPLVY